MGGRGLSYDCAMAESGVEAFQAHLRACLEPVLGRHTTGHAIKLASERIGAAPESLSWADAEAVANALAPLMRTLLGRESTEAVTDKIRNKGGEA